MSIFQIKNKVDFTKDKIKVAYERKKDQFEKDKMKNSYIKNQINSKIKKTEKDVSDDKNEKIDQIKSDIPNSSDNLPANDIPIEKQWETMDN